MENIFYIGFIKTSQITRVMQKIQYKVYLKSHEDNISIIYIFQLTKNVMVLATDNEFVEDETIFIFETTANNNEKTQNKRAKTEYDSYMDNARGKIESKCCLHCPLPRPCHPPP